MHEAEAKAEAEPIALGSTSPSVNCNSRNMGKRCWLENSGGGSPINITMGGGESANSDNTSMEVEPQPPTAKCERCGQAQDRQQNAVLPLTEQNGSGSGSGHILCLRAAAPVSSSHR